MHRVGQYPTVAKYNRIPTRDKVRFFWGAVASGVLLYQVVKFTVTRVMPKREEYYYDSLNQLGEVPEKIMEYEKATRELRETLSIHNVTQIPGPGEFVGAMQTEFHPNNVEVLRSHTNKTGSRSVMSS